MVLGALLAWGSLSAADLVETPSVHFQERGTATIRWATDVPTRGRVIFGVRPDRMTESAEGPVTNRHSVSLSGVPSNERCYYAIGTARVWLATNSFMAGKAFTPVSSSSKPALSRSQAPPAASSAPPARKTWGHLVSLPDHYDRHGGDFQAKNPEDYARLAWEFLQRGRQKGWPAKVDEDQVLRVFDPGTGSFAAYNRDGTTKTFFKPGSRDYFERQPGRLIDLTTWKER
jgi:pyocin large subunit-like protein